MIKLQAFIYITISIILLTQLSYVNAAKEMKLKARKEKIPATMGELIQHKQKTKDVKKIVSSQGANLYTKNGETNWNYVNRGKDWTWGCKGDEQSPIDIEAIKGSCDNSMIFDFTLSDDTVDSKMENKDNMLQAKGDFSKLYATDVDGNLAGYNSIGLEIHSPSEHKIEGHIYDAELHIIHEMRKEFHKKQPRTRAIVSLFFSVDDNAGPNKLLQGLKIDNPGAFSIKISNLLKKQLSNPIVYFAYKGSGSTPPCKENVNWYVIEKPLYITTGQLATFNRLWKNKQLFAKGNGNNRASKQLNERLVKKGGIQCEEQFVYFFSFFILYIFINYFIFKLL